MSFDRDAAVRDWRISILSRGGLTVTEVDELQDHLEHIEADLLDHLLPEEAFWLAAHRVGTPDALTREFGKVRPNMGWHLRAQWVLLGLLAYVLLMPAVQALLHLLVAVLARSPSLIGLAAAVRLYAGPLAIAIVFSGVAFAVRRSGASPAAVDRVVSAIGSSRWPALPLAVLGLVAWEVGVYFLAGTASSLARETLNPVGGPAPLQSELWYWLSTGLVYAYPAFLLGLIVRIQRRLEAAMPALRSTR